MKKMVKFFVALVCFVSLLAVTACGSSAKGSVYYLNFKPEVDANWQALAKKYTEETGVEVKVVTAASGKYETTLTSEMDKTNAPTLFQISGTVGYENWKDYCLDLSKSDVYKELTSDDFAVKVGNGVYGIAYVYEGYGIIVNKGLLESKTTYKVSDITSFAKLKEVAEYITANKSTLGISAFTSSTLDDGSSWRFSGHLANVALAYEWAAEGYTTQPATIKGNTLDGFKNMWDLYINNATVAKDTLNTAKNAEEEFKNLEAVFFQNGTWEYPAVGTDKDGNKIELAYLPLYMGIDDANEGLACGTENYWAVNKTASKADQKATLEFLKWVVTSEAGTKGLADMGFVSPFKKAKSSGNVLADLMNEYVANGKKSVAWTPMNQTPNTDSWRAGVVSALAAYSSDSTTAKWEAVKAAMVTGWANEYNKAHQ